MGKYHKPVFIYIIHFQSRLCLETNFYLLSIHENSKYCNFGLNSVLYPILSYIFRVWYKYFWCFNFFNGSSFFYVSDSHAYLTTSDVNSFGPYVFLPSNFFNLPIFLMSLYGIERITIAFSILFYKERFIFENMNCKTKMVGKSSISTKYNSID